MTDKEFNRTLQLFRESGRSWSEHWMDQPWKVRPAYGPSLLHWIAPVLATAAAALFLILPAPQHRAPERPFVPIRFVEPPAPYERVAVERMTVPVAALVAAGFDLPGGDPSGSVDADVLIGQDGRAHAIRLRERTLQ